MSTGRSKFELFDLLLISAIWVAMVACANPIGNFPLNDDWVYGLAVRSVLENGYYNFPSPTSANVGPQIYWGALFCLPFGFSFTALRISTLALGLFGLFALYGLLKQLAKDRRLAIFGALVLAVNPFYFGLANSFMTDVPFVAVVLIALFFVVRGFQNDSPSAITAGVVFIFVAIFIRQFGLVLLAAFMVAYVLKYGFTLANVLKTAALLVCGVSAHFGYQYWLLHTQRTPLLALHSETAQLIPSWSGVHSMFGAATNALLYLGLFVFPFLVVLAFFGREEKNNASRRVLRLVLFFSGALFFMALQFHGRAMPFAINVLIPSGMGPLTLRDTFILTTNLPPISKPILVFWNMVTALAVAGAFAAVYYVVLSMRQTIIEFSSGSKRAGTWIAALLGGTAALYFGLLFLAANRVTVFDRYFILFAPLTMCFVLKSNLREASTVSSSKLLAPVCLLILYAVFSVCITHDYLSWNRARWNAVAELMQLRKVTPNQIDGGYEFNGWYLYDSKYQPRPELSSWWVRSDEYVIASGPLPAYSALGRITFKRWFLQSDSSIFILHKDVAN